MDWLRSAALFVREDDGISRACQEELSTNESLIVPGTVLYSATLGSMCCVCLTFCCGFSVGYNSGVYSIPTGLDKVLAEQLEYTANTAA